MPPELVELALGMAYQRSGEEHTPKLEVHITSPHHRIESVEMASRVVSSIVQQYMREVEPRREWYIRDMRSKRLKLLVRVMCICLSLILEFRMQIQTQKS